MIDFDDSNVLKDIEAKIEIHPDFPKKGILFRDVLPILRDVQLRDNLVEVMINCLDGVDFDVVVGLEARGFLLGMLVATRAKKPFVPLRKKGKLPGQTHSVSYGLEYGQDTLELQKGAILEGTKCLLVDDLLATGGTMLASKKLINLATAQVVCAIVVIHLLDLNGQDKLEDTKLISLFKY